MSGSVHPDVVRRILEVRLEIEARLSQPLSVEELARIARLSVFHFQRTFRRVVGESVAQHLRRLRLERAAYWLRHSETPVTEIALSSGFDSHAGFTHAFTKLYGLSPSSFRERHEVRPFIRQRHEGRPAADADALARCPLTVSLEEVPTRTLAVMRCVGPSMQLPLIWPKMIDFCRRRRLLNEHTEFLGLHHDDWETTLPDAYRYDAAVVVDPGFEPDDEVALVTQPGGLVAKTAFRGSLAGLDRTWRQFAEDWLSVSGLQFRLTHVYDVYPAELLCGSLLTSVLRTLTGIRATLCIPVSQDWVDESER